MPTFVEAKPTGARLKREQAAWILAGLFFLATVTLVVLYSRKSPARTYPASFLVLPPENSVFNAFDLAFPVAVSPDGTKIVLAVLSGQQRQLWLRSLDSLTMQPLAGTEGAVNPFWSPDGRFIGFFAGGKLKKVAVTGGPPIVICDASPNANSGTWNREDLILFTVGQNDKGILKVDAAGGEPTTVAQPDSAKKETYRFWPSFLPDGRHFLYLTGKRQRADSELCLGSLDSSEAKPLMKISSRALYSPPGYLLFVRDGALQARPFDARSLNFTGEEITVAEQIGNFSSTGDSYFSVSANGEVLSYLSGTRTSKLVWLDRTGKEIGSVGQPNNYWLPRLSPDGKKLAVDLVDPKDGSDDIWIQDFERGTFTRFTFDLGLENGSVWFPDGSSIVYARDRDGPPHLFQKMLGATSEAELLLNPESTGPQYPLDFTPDGKFLIYQALRANNGLDLLVLPMEGDRKPYPFAQTQFNEQFARISPDGKWVAFTCDQTGRREIYVQRWGGGERIQISNRGGSNAHWSSGGNELVFLAERKMMAMAVKTGDKFEASAPVELFAYDGMEYEVSSDGQRFLIRTTAGVPPLPLTVATGWAANLRR